MAALDEKVKTGIELRPCIVHVPALTETFCNMSGKRTTKEIRSKEEHKGLFHFWGFRSKLYDASPMIGGHPGGQVSETFAIVEYEDGTIHKVEPTQIQFVDNAMSEYAFSEMEDSNGN